PDVSAGKNLNKQRRPAAGRPAKKAGAIGKAVKATAGKASARAGAKRSRPVAKLATKPRTKPAAKSVPKLTAKPAAMIADKHLTNQAVTPIAEAPAPSHPPEPAAAPVPKKPSFYEAIGIYESGVRGLQRHDYWGAAESFRQVLQRYPEER